jgi:ribonuclease P protein component
VLPLQHRINHSDDFRRVFGRGKKHSTALGLIATSPTDGVPRLGVVVSKAVGGAVVRNLVKRRVRSAFKELLPTMDALDVVVKAAPGAHELSFNQVFEFLASATTGSKASS